MSSYKEKAYSTSNTLQNTMFFTNHVLDSHIKGALVECGVAVGAQLAAMQETLLRRGDDMRWIYGFDSFEGIPLASEDDDEQPGIPGPRPLIAYKDKRDLLKSSGITVCKKEEVLRYLQTWFPTKHDNIVLVKGWFQDTLVPYTSVLQALGGISLLRLDGDLYESTKVSLEALFPLLNPGGVLIIDDWNLGGCRKACLQYFETADVTQVDPPHGDMTDGPAYFIKT